jgi:ketosteroid isomerase-like protein
VIIQQAFDAYRRRDLDALLALVDPEVEVRSLMTEAERTTYRGHDGVRDWFDAVFGVFPDWCPELDTTREVAPGKVVAGFCAKATAAASGVHIEQDYWQAARLRNSRILSFGFYRTEADALEALGEI